VRIREEFLTKDTKEEKITKKRERMCSLSLSKGAKKGAVFAGQPF